MFRHTVSSLALALALAAYAPAGTFADEPKAAAAEQGIHAEIQAFFADAMKARLALNPLQAERLGDKSRNSEWPEISDAAQDKELALYKAQLEKLHTFDMSKLNDADKLSYRIFDITAKRYIENDKWRDYGYPVNQMFGWQTGLPTHLMTVHTVDTAKDAEAYITRLGGMKKVLDELSADLVKRQGKGILPPKFVYPLVLSACENILKGAPFEGGDDSVLLADFRKKVEKLDIDAAAKADLISRAEAAMLSGVKPGYDHLITTLKAQEAVATTEDGVWKFPNGAAYYAQELKNNTTTDLSAKEIHQIGLDNVARIHKAMREIMKQVDFKGSLQEFFEFTRNDPRFYYPDTEEGKADYIAQAQKYVDEMYKKVPEYFSHTPKGPLEVRAVEKFREKSAGKAFYNRGTPDGSRPGIFYANLRDMKDMPNYQLEALVYHEGIPGHHFQISLAQELEGVPLFQRTARFTAFSEGWGLYTEELGKDMGFYQDPYSDFGRLAMELWRACRLVVDTGLHDKHWTREQAIEYLVENTPNSRGDATNAIERYIVMPGQATAYMIGKLKIMELREQAKKDLGDKFTYAGFHEVVLESGAVPLSILEENVKAWVASLK